MVVTYYIKLFRMGADRHNGILMSLLLLVTETRITAKLILNVAQYGAETKNIFHSRSYKLALNGFFHLLMLLKNIRFASYTKRL